MRTNAMFINEYSLSDSVIECAEEVVASVMSAAWDYENHKRDIELRAVLESADTTAILLEKEGQGFLASVGNAIMTLIHKVEEFLKKITDVLFGSLKKNKDEVEIVTKLITQYPELKTVICKGLNEEWFTYKDIAAYEKDVCGLIQMLEKKSIDHQTFKDKLKKAMDKFNDSAQPLVTAAKNVGDLLGFIPKVHEHATNGKKAMQSLSSTLKTFKKNVDHNYGKQEAGVIKSIVNALGQAVGLCSKECEYRVKSTSKLGWYIHKLSNSKIGTLLKLDDVSRSGRHEKIWNKSTNAERKASLEAEYKSILDNVNHAKDKVNQLRREGKKPDDPVVIKAVDNRDELRAKLTAVKKKLYNREYEVQ